MSASDISCIYRFQEAAGNAMAVGEGCAPLVPQNAPLQGVACEGLGADLDGELCALFDSADESLRAADSSQFDIPPSGKQSFLVVWRATAEIAEGGVASILSKQNSVYPYFGWNLSVLGSVGGIGVFVGEPAGSSPGVLGTNVITDLQYDDLVPPPLALVFDRDADTMMLITEREVAGPVDLSSIVSVPSMEPFHVGRVLPDSEDYVQVPTGEIAYLVVLDTALTPTQLDRFWELTD